MSTRGIVVIGNRYFFIRYNAHTAGEWFKAAFRMRPKTIDQFVSSLNMFEGAVFVEWTARKAHDFMDTGVCEVVWDIDFRKRGYRKKPVTQWKRDRNQRSKQNRVTGEIVILSATDPQYWFGEKRDYDLPEIRNNKDWVDVPRVKKGRQQAKRGNYLKMGIEYCDTPGSISYGRRMDWATSGQFRSFDGRSYVHVHNFLNKYYADIYAKKWREEGYLARVTYDGTITTGIHAGKPSHTVWVSKP